ncbi:MAG: quinoprotein relay system zinc metallohydrolase 2 [Gammaproteobacteria bacterium]
MVRSSTGIAPGPRRRSGVHTGSAGLRGSAAGLHKLILPALPLILLALVPVAAGAPAREFNMTQVADGIHVHQGVHAGIEDEKYDDAANIGFIVGENCVAVIDTGGSIETGESLRNAVRSVTDRRICYVINTHEHYDHLLGNAAFEEDSPEFLGHADLPDAVAASTPLFLRQFGMALGSHPGADRIIGPQRTVESVMRIDLGGRVIALTAQPAAHSHTDLTILDAKTGTLWLGDLVFMERIPALDGGLNGWIALLHELQSIEAARVVPGHGPAHAAWPDAARATLEYLENLRTEVRDCIARGLSLEDALEVAGEKEKMRWLLQDQHHGRNVSKAYIELEWE